MAVKEMTGAAQSLHGIEGEESDEVEAEKKGELMIRREKVSGVTGRKRCLGRVKNRLSTLMT